MYRLITRFACLAALFGLAACGGGGGGGGGASAPSLVPSAPANSWTAGEFQNDRNFAGQCANPRTGTDPEGNRYPDTAGDILDENNFLRSWSNNTYLWYDEITDQDPSTFDDPLTYFDQLRTFATTASGADKDKFHFTYDSDDWYQISRGGVSTGYGAEWAVISSRPPRKIVVAFTEPGSAATDNNLARGAIVLKVDGLDVDSTAEVDALNNAMWPSASGETHTFTIQELDGTVRELTMTSSEITTATVQNTGVISTPTGNVGYMTFNYFRAPAEKALVEAVNQLIAADIDDLVLDLRYNGGGYLDIASQLAYMIAGPIATAGKSFETIQFNDQHPTRNPVTGNNLSPTPFHNSTLDFSLTPGQSLPTLDLTRLYVLTSGGTCSASEAVINGLRGIDVEVILIGSTTCGKPYGFYATDNCGTTYFTVQFRGINDRGFGDYTDGFVVASEDDGMANVLGCQVADDFTQPLGSPSENRLEVALAHRAGQGCVAPATAQSGVQQKSAQPLDAADGWMHRSHFDSNRILRQ